MLLNNLLEVDMIIYDFYNKSSAFCNFTVMLLNNLLEVDMIIYDFYITALYNLYFWTLNNKLQLLSYWIFFTIKNC